MFVTFLELEEEAGLLLELELELEPEIDNLTPETFLEELEEDLELLDLELPELLELLLFNKPIERRASLIKE